MAYYARAELRDAEGNMKTGPRLEVVFDCLTHAVGLRCLSALSKFVEVPPNDLHLFLAKHLEAGGQCVTVNFDDCIERAISGSSPRGVIHIHGVYNSNAESLRRLGARLATVSSGLTADIQSQLIQILNHSSAIVFAGYSGSDFFDVNPFFRNLAETGLRLSHLNAIWICHIDGTALRVIESLPNAPGMAMLSGLAACGARVAHVVGSTSEFFDTLRRQWYREDYPLKTRSSLPVSSLTISTPVTWCEQVCSSTYLFETMGIGQEITSRETMLRHCMEEDSKTDGNHNRRLWSLDIGYRDQGYYCRSRRVLREIVPESHAESLRRLNRVAGNYWLAGDHLRAWWYHRAALAAATAALDHTSSEDSAEIRGIRHTMLVEFLHWFRDVWTIPGLGVVARVLEGDHVKQMFQELLADEVWDRRPARNKSALVRLYNEIPLLKADTRLAPPVPSDDAHVAPFLESDSFIGAVNFTRRRLLDELVAGGGLPVDESQWLVRLSEIIGDNPGVLKMTLIMHQQRCEVRLPWATLRRVEWTFLRKAIWLIHWFRASTGMRPHGRDIPREQNARAIGDT